MESLSGQRRRPLLIIAVILIVLGIGGLSYHFDLWPWHRGLARRLDLDPQAQLRLQVRLLTPEHKAYAGPSLMGWLPLPDAEQPEKITPPPYTACPLWYGGDLGFTRVFPAEIPTAIQQQDDTWQERFDPLRPDCIATRTVQWLLVRSPVALTITVQDPKSLFTWLRQEPIEAKLAPIRDLLGPLRDVLALPLDQFALQGLKAQVAADIVTDILAQDARVHYDRWRGRRGYILSFASQQPSLGREAVYAYLKQRVERQYRVGGLSIFEAPFLQHRLFALETAGRTYLAFDLSALLNLLDAGQDQEVMPSLTQKGLAMRIRPGAWFKHLAPLVFGRADTAIDLTLQMAPSQNWTIQLMLPKSGLLTQLGGQQDGQIWKAIPSDAFFALTAQVRAPLTWQPASWGDRLLKGEAPWPSHDNRPLGLGIVWDFESQDSNPRTVDEVFGFILRRTNNQDPWPSPPLLKMDASDCDEGRTLIVASSARLKQRMLEACAGQNPSWARARNQAPTQTLAAYIAPSQLVTRLLSLGGAYTTLARMQAEPKRIPGLIEAHTAALQQTESAWAQLPTLLFLSADESKQLTLNGFIL